MIDAPVIDAPVIGAPAAARVINHRIGGAPVISAHAAARRRIDAPVAGDAAVTRVSVAHIDARVVIGRTLEGDAFMSHPQVITTTGVSVLPTKDAVAVAALRYAITWYVRSVREACIRPQCRRQRRGVTVSL